MMGEEDVGCSPSGGDDMNTTDQRRSELETGHEMSCSKDGVRMTKIEWNDLVKLVRDMEVMEKERTTEHESEPPKKRRMLHRRTSSFVLMETCSDVTDEMSGDDTTIEKRRSSKEDLEDMIIEVIRRTPQRRHTEYARPPFASQRKSFVHGEQKYYRTAPARMSMSLPTIIEE